MTPEQCKVHEFHLKHSINSGIYPSVKKGVYSRESYQQVLFHRARLIVEEASEFVSAASMDHLVDMADALADILYVVYGAADQIGIDLEPIFNEVHRANMTKTGFHGQKVMKGPKFQEPELIPILREQGLI